MAPSNQLLEKIKSSKAILSQFREKANEKIDIEFLNIRNLECLYHYNYVIKLLFRKKLFKENK
jgi:patatin-like phospholipase/acyl hydrolase